MNRTQNARPILVAVRTLDRSAHSILRKAASLATLYDAPVRIVHVLAIPQGALARAGATVRQAAQADLDQRTVRLEKLAQRAELRQLRVTSTVRCDYPVQDALVREAIACHARMLLVESHGPGRLARMFLSNIDWDLIRNCPCPLWLSKSHKFNSLAPIIAAVDPLHAHAKPAMLDDTIVAHAIEASGSRPSKVVLCHAYSLPQGAITGSPVEAHWIAMTEDEQRAYQRDLERAIERLQRKADIPSDNAAVVRGDPAFQLPRLAKKHSAALVVMGAVSRRGLKRVFIGNTAERVIDKLDCDVLVLKPRGFKSLVERQTYRRPIPRPRRYALASRHGQSGGNVTYVTH
ncbi:universal stress protein [Peristeroidobacter agariperforans]|uniref:universal stress protein n=1 Tax=Peristeroidobacter agariperforans TaxID=268404 RepID=UPI0018E57747|nr:universal stress protein [Peristeroidobacter agariperforans]